MAAAIPEEIYLKEEKVHSAFLMFDRDKTGKVSKNELKKTLGSKIISKDNKTPFFESRACILWIKRGFILGKNNGGLWP